MSYELLKAKMLAAISLRTWLSETCYKIIKSNIFLRISYHTVYFKVKYTKVFN